MEKDTETDRIITWIKAAMEHAGVSQATLNRAIWPNDRSVLGKILKDKRRVQVDELVKIAKETSYRPYGVADGPEDNSSLSQYGNEKVNHRNRKVPAERNASLQAIPGTELMGSVDLPVHSIVQGGRGALVLSSDPYTHVARPHNLLGIVKAYGVLVAGNSMAKEFREGDIAYVNPHLHPREGDPCVFQHHNDHGDVEAVIKYLARSPDASDKVYYVAQSNPEKKFTLKKAEWQFCHVVVGKQSAR